VVLGRSRDGQMAGGVVVEEARLELEPECGVVIRCGRHVVDGQERQPLVRPSVSCLMPFAQEQEREHQGWGRHATRAMVRGHVLMVVWMSAWGSAERSLGAIENDGTDMRQ
jgi:hypothetical protein